MDRQEVEEGEGEGMHLVCKMKKKISNKKEVTSKHPPFQPFLSIPTLYTIKGTVMPYILPY